MMVTGRVSSDRPTRILLWVLALLVALAGTQQAYIMTRPHPERLLEYPRQSVMNTLPGVDGPAVQVGQSIRVEGTKCNRSDVGIQVSGTVTWVSVDPPGSVIQVGGTGAATRAPGCETNVYENPIPPGVVNRTEELARGQGKRQAVIWKISGVETPDDSRTILPESWSTESFAVYLMSPK